MKVNGQFEGRIQVGLPGCTPPPKTEIKNIL
jgi:hypothetical protein